MLSEFNEVDLQVNMWRIADWIFFSNFLEGYMLILNPQAFSINQSINHNNWMH